MTDSFIRSDYNDYLSRNDHMKLSVMVLFPYALQLILLHSVIIFLMSFTGQFGGL